MKQHKSNGMEWSRGPSIVCSPWICATDRHCKLSLHACSMVEEVEMTRLTSYHDLGSGVN